MFIRENFKIIEKKSIYHPKTTSYHWLIPSLPLCLSSSLLPSLSFYPLTVVLFLLSYSCDLTVYIIWYPAFFLFNIIM